MDPALPVDGPASQIPYPVKVTGMAGVADVSTGGGRTCARKLDGTVWCWGDSYLGDGRKYARGGPVQVALGDAVAEISAGTNHVCARKVDGSLWCWGYNQGGEIGDGALGVDAWRPVHVVALGRTVARVSSGHAFTCALDVSGVPWCWGLNSAGQLGDGTTEGVACLSGVCRPSPVRVVGLCP